MAEPEWRDIPVEKAYEMMKSGQIPGIPEALRNVRILCIIILYQLFVSLHYPP